MTDDQLTDAAAYLGLTSRQTDRLAPAVIDAATTDDLGAVPPDMVTSTGWDHLTDHDRDQVLRFRRVLAALGEGRT